MNTTPTTEQNPATVHSANFDTAHSIMIPGSSYDALKTKMPVIKQLFQTRHYIQCATLCESLLTRADQKIHPIHEAYLNFYLALSHDTMAREAGMRNRDLSLEMAEKHYLAAITALTPAPSQSLDAIQDSQSPTSSESDGELARRRLSDAASQHSDHSTSTAATSIADEDRGANLAIKILPKKTVSFTPSPSPDSSDAMETSTPSKRKPAPILTLAKQPPSFFRQKFSIDLSSFTSMVKAHLVGVRELKDIPVAPIHRVSFVPSSSRNSTISSRPVSRNSTHAVVVSMDMDRDRVRLKRRSMNFRPRFDPTSVQKLCDDALKEI